MDYIKRLSSSAWWINFQSISFSLTCPNLYEPYKYWGDSVKDGKAKMKSTNFIQFEGMTHCPFVLSICFAPVRKKPNANCRQQCANVICISEELRRTKEGVECLLVLNLSHFYQSPLPSHLCRFFCCIPGRTHITLSPFPIKSIITNIETCKENVSILVPRTKAASRRPEKSLHWKPLPNSSFLVQTTLNLPEDKKMFTVLLPYRISHNRQYEVWILWGKFNHQDWRKRHLLGMTWDSSGACISAKFCCIFLKVLITPKVLSGIRVKPVSNPCDTAQVDAGVASQNFCSKNNIM